MGYLGYAYLAAALAVGAASYWRRPGLYVSFVWWLWFLTPEVRRLLDYVQGWDPLNPVVLAPYLASSLTFFTLVHHLPKMQLKRYFPFFLVFLGLFYAYAVGLYRAGAPSATYHLIEWLVPVVFAFHLIVNWYKYPIYRRAVQRTFLLGITIMGVYGVVQFFVLPPWDRYWMENAPITSVGQPEPLEVLVFSTLNSPQPFALAMMAGLLLLSSANGLARWPAAAAGFLSFLLSLKRAAWGGWLAGMLFIVLQRRRLGSVVPVILAIALIVLPLLTIGPVADRINERVGTIAELGEDTSFRARVDFYQETATQALLNPVGSGFGATGESTKLSAEGGGVGELGENAAFDSGILEIPFLLGWPGSILYIAGLIWLLSYAFSSKDHSDTFAVASRAIVVGILIQLVFNDTIVGLGGMLFWTFAGLAIGSEVYRHRILSGTRSEATTDYRGEDIRTRSEISDARSIV